VSTITPGTEALPRVEGMAVDGRVQAPDLQERKMRPGFAIVILLVQAWTYAHWFADGFHSAPLGPTPVPEHVKIAAIFWQVVGAGGAVLAIVFLVIRPWRRTGHLTVNGMLVIAFFQLWSFQDACLNFFVNQFQWNAYFVNFGSWYSWIPGWEAPRSHFMGEPILFCGGLYIWLFAVGMIFLNWVMRKAKQRWPRIGKLGLVLIAMVTAGVLDSAFEIIWLHQGLYAYGAHINAITLWPSKQYAFPIDEGVLWGITWGALASLRFFTNDRGQMATERGLENSKASAKRKQGIRLLGLIGAVNASMFLFYNLPYQFFGLESNSIPTSVTDKSYLTDGVCGIGTNVACTPNDSLPVQLRSTQAYFTPLGKLVTPTPIPIEPGARRAKLLKDPNGFN
jgi:hypothetical protein